jgi:outer membrane protein assembly factor BamB
MRNLVRTAYLLVGLGAPCLSPLTSAAGDWPQWRGPNRDGVVHGATVPAKWPKTLREDWKVEVGEGVASPVVVGGHVFVFTRQNGNEVGRCLDVASGKEIWQSEPYAAPYQRGGGEGDFSIGPRSTPAVADGKVYTLGMCGMLSYWDAKTGKLLWRKDCKPYHPYSGNSPLVADGLCIVHYGDSDKAKPLGGLTAFDAATGEVRWCYAEGSRPASSSPILATLAGERQVVTLTSWNLVGVSAATGKKLWSVRLDGPEKNLTPVQYKDMLIYADYKARPQAIRLDTNSEKSGEKRDEALEAKRVWKGDGPTLYMSSPVLDGDRLLGFSTEKLGHLFCCDAKTGKTLWQSGGRLGGYNTDYASLVNLGPAWMALTSRGQLFIVRSSGTGYEPIAHYQVSDRATYAHPVFLGDRILIKDELTIRSLRIAQDGDEP